jgi:hypothetical protein
MRAYVRRKFPTMAPLIAVGAIGAIAPVVESVKEAQPVPVRGRRPIVITQAMAGRLMAMAAKREAETEKPVEGESEPARA